MGSQIYKVVFYCTKTVYPSTQKVLLNINKSVCTVLITERVLFFKKMRHFVKEEWFKCRKESTVKKNWNVGVSL